MLKNETWGCAKDLGRSFGHSILLYFGNLPQQRFYNNSTPCTIFFFFNEWTLRSPESSRNHGLPYSTYSPFEDIHIRIWGHFSLLCCYQFFSGQLGKANNDAFFLPSQKSPLLQIEWQNIKSCPHTTHIDLKNCNSSFNMAISFCSRE